MMLQRYTKKRKEIQKRLFISSERFFTVKNVLHVRMLLVGMASVLLCSNVMAEDDDFTVATLNVDGLPTKILIIPSNPDGPGDEGTLAVSRYLEQKGYDILGVQEDFNYDDQLRSALQNEYDYGLWQGDIDLGDVNWLKFWDTKFETDGLRVFWRKQHQLENEKAIPWTDSYGKFDHCWDDMVTKGFRHCEMTLSSGLRIVVYDMHMDASEESDEENGDDGGDKEARCSQWHQLKDYVMARLDERPVILMGDMNSLYPRDSIKRMFIDPINATGHHFVSDAWVEHDLGGQYPEYSGSSRKVANENGEVLDKILYINPLQGKRLQLKSYVVGYDYVWDDGSPMGDHFPVSARFGVVDDQQTAISQPQEGQSSRQIYTVDGRQQTLLQKGLNIVRQADGTIKKVIRKWISR